MLDIAIIEGVRTPFVKAFGALAGVPAQFLGRRVTQVVLERAEVRPDQVDQVVFGNAATPPDAANIARVIALRAGIPPDRTAHTVHRNCASGMEAITTAARLIQLGEARTVVAGGAESMSQVPLLFSKEAAGLFLELSRGKGLRAKLRALLRFRPRYLRPVPGLRLGLTDPVCGLMMGETAEVLAAEFGISRQEQDTLALESHRRAAAAQERYALDQETTPLYLEREGREIKEDIGPRRDQSMPALARLRPYFQKDGTVTIGNSCGVTDGAAAVVLMPGEAARAEGRTPLGYLRAYANAGCDPRRMGLGPVYAVNQLLARAGLDLKDLDLIELNEAFAAQVVACERAFASDRFAEQELGRASALGELGRERLNVNGGAIALGHPVGATGVRLVITLLKELRRRGRKRGLATLCVGGGQGAAVLVETA